MEKLAAIFGTFCGKVLAVVLKESGPELRAFMIGVIADAIKLALEDKADVSKSGAIDALGAVGVRKTGADNSTRTNGNP